MKLVFALLSAALMCLTLPLAFGASQKAAAAGPASPIPRALS